MVLVIVLRAGYVGSLRGVWVEALRLLSIVGAVAVAAMVSGPLAGQLASAPVPVFGEIAAARSNGSPDHDSASVAEDEPALIARR